MPSPLSEWNPGFSLAGQCPSHRTIAAGGETRMPVPVCCVASSFFAAAAAQVATVDRTLALDPGIGFWVFDVRAVKRVAVGGAGDDVTVENAGTAVTNTMLLDNTVANETIVRATSINDAVNSFAAGATITINFDNGGVGGATNPSADVFILGFPVVTETSPFTPLTPWHPGSTGQSAAQLINEHVSAGVTASSFGMTGVGATRHPVGLCGYVFDTGAFAAAGTTRRYVTIPAGVTFRVVDGLVIKTNGNTGANANLVIPYRQTAADIALDPALDAATDAARILDGATDVSLSLTGVTDTSIARFGGVDDANASLAAGDRLAVEVTNVGGDASCLVVVLGVVS